MKYFDKNVHFQSLNCDYMKNKVQMTTRLHVNEVKEYETQRHNLNLIYSIFIYFIIIKIIQHGDTVFTFQSKLWDFKRYLNRERQNYKTLILTF